MCYLCTINIVTSYEHLHNRVVTKKITQRTYIFYLYTLLIILNYNHVVIEKKLY
jgi:hypothetical protein